MSGIDETWDALRAENRRETGWHLRRMHPAALCEIFAGIHQPDSTPGLIIEVDADSVPPDLRLPKSAGFSLETILRGHAHHGRVRVTLSLAQSAYAAVFAVLADDAAACAAAEPDERSALSCFVDRLHIWQNFMARHGPDGLSESAAIGLMGELYILKDYVAPAVGPEHAVAAWSGPGGEPNDFTLSGGFLEVKATARQVARAITVSGADQLDNSRGADPSRPPSLPRLSRRHDAPRTDRGRSSAAGRGSAIQPVRVYSASPVRRLCRRTRRELHRTTDTRRGRILRGQVRIPLYRQG